MPGPGWYSVDLDNGPVQGTVTPFAEPDTTHILPADAALHAGGSINVPVFCIDTLAALSTSATETYTVNVYTPNKPGGFGGPTPTLVSSEIFSLEGVLNSIYADTKITINTPTTQSNVGPAGPTPPQANPGTQYAPSLVTQGRPAETMSGYALELTMSAQETPTVGVGSAGKYVLTSPVCTLATLTVAPGDTPFSGTFDFLGLYTDWSLPYTAGNGETSYHVVRRCYFSTLTAPGGDFGAFSSAYGQGAFPAADPRAYYEYGATGPAAPGNCLSVLVGNDWSLSQSTDNPGSLRISLSPSAVDTELFQEGPEGQYGPEGHFWNFYFSAALADGQGAPFENFAGYIGVYDGEFGDVSLGIAVPSGTIPFTGTAGKHSPFFGDFPILPGNGTKTVSVTITVTAQPGSYQAGVGLGSRPFWSASKNYTITVPGTPPAGGTNPPGPTLLDNLFLARDASRRTVAAQAGSGLLSYLTTQDAGHTFETYAIPGTSGAIRPALALSLSTARICAFYVLSGEIYQVTAHGDGETTSDWSAPVSVVAGDYCGVAASGAHWALAYLSGGAVLLKTSGDAGMSWDDPETVAAGLDLTTGGRVAVAYVGDTLRIAVPGSSLVVYSNATGTWVPSAVPVPLS